jgi:hypothetical protein
MSGKGFGKKEYKQVRITDSGEGNQEEKEALVEITKQKIAAKESSSTQGSVPFVDESKLNEIVQNAIAAANSKAADQRQLEAEQKQKEIDSLKQSLLQQFQEQATEKEKERDRELEAVRQTLNEAQEQLKQSKETIDKFEDLFKLTGSKNPLQEKGVNFNTHIASDRDKVFGTFAEALQIYDSAPKVRKITEQGQSAIDFDKWQLNKFVRQNRRQLLDDLTEWGKKRGWFAGGSVIPVTEASTTIADLPGGFLPTLSAIVRTTHRPGYIFWQFPLTQFDFAAGMGDTISVPRFRYLVSSPNPDDYKLSGGGTFAPIVASSDNIQTGVVPLTVEEWGRGKPGASVALSPISIPSFVSFYSMYDLVAQLDRLLGFDYATWEDKKIRSYFNVSSRVVYNDRGRVTTTPGDLGAGDNGTVTRLFAINLHAYMKLLQIEPLADGCYIWALNSTGEAQLKADLEDKWEAPNESALRDLTNVLNPALIPPEDSGRISGYLGKYYNFHFFSSNSFSVGAAGTEGVQDDPLGVGSTLTRTSYAFGAGVEGRGIGMPMELRQDSVTNFDRETRMTWLSQEGFGALDIDPVGYNDTSAVPQQLRVIKVRTTDLAI